MKIRSHKDLDVYKLAFELAMKVFDISRAFPKEEKYSLTDQIRRSSRSVCANLGEAFRKRRYAKADALCAAYDDVIGKLVTMCNQGDKWCL